MGRNGWHSSGVSANLRPRPEPAAALVPLGRFADTLAFFRNSSIMTPETTPAAETATLLGQVRVVARSPRRLLFAVLGVMSVGLAVAGIFVPVLPTTIFLIIASWLLTKSCPYLEERLIRNRLFGPYLRYLDGAEPMPFHARVKTIAMVWIAVLTSLAVLAWRDAPAPWLIVLLLALACTGTWFIATWRRGA